MHQDIQIRDSPIHGRGLFAKKLIPKGTITWVLDEKKAEFFTEKQYFALNHEKQKEIWNYGFDVGEITILIKDESKFENHSDSPNIKSISFIEYALKDIQKDDELTVNYREMQNYE